MRIDCPLCGARDLREFTYRGAALLLDRPGPEAGAAAIDAYLHLRDNPAGPNAELWQHAAGCRAWLRVVRDTRTHAILGVGLARAAVRAGSMAAATGGGGEPEGAGVAATDGLAGDAAARADGPGASGTRAAGEAPGRGLGAGGEAAGAEGAASRGEGDA